MLDAYGGPSDSPDGRRVRETALEFLAERVMR